MTLYFTSFISSVFTFHVMNPHYIQMLSHFLISQIYACHRNYPLSCTAKVCTLLNALLLFGSSKYACLYTFTVEANQSISSIVSSVACMRKRPLQAEGRFSVFEKVEQYVSNGQTVRIVDCSMVFLFYFVTAICKHIERYVY